MQCFQSVMWLLSTPLSLSRQGILLNLTSQSIRKIILDLKSQATYNFQNYYHEKCIISIIHITRNKLFDHVPEMSSNQRFLWFRGLFDKNRIAKCKKGVLIVNNARGAIADTQAIADACSSGHVAGNSKTRWQKCLCFQQQNKKLLLN